MQKSNENWTLTFTCSDWEVKDFSFSLPSDQLLELTRLSEFQELIESSAVEGALIAYGESLH